jgi:dihydropteroate synthase
MNKKLADFEDDKIILSGVINISPDSYYEKSVINDKKELSKKIAEFKEYDVDYIDIGAMSTKPVSIYGGQLIDKNTELKRLKKILPELIKLTEKNEILVSLDTQYSECAKYGLELGIHMVNDISGFKTDPKILELLLEYDCDVAIMATNELPGDICGMKKTIESLKSSLIMAEKFGIQKNRIAIDPGFGGWQGRSEECDLDLLKNFDRLKLFKLPIYVGISRKSTIKTLNGGKEPNDRLAGSLVLTNWLIEKGAKIIRTHDVKETRYAINVMNKLKKL